jgi:sugar-phosphatase
MAAAGIPVPAVMITAEEVSAGKPDPAGFLLAAQRLGVDATQCLIFEDAKVGIFAAQASGADLLIITSTHQHPIQTSHQTMPDYESVTVQADSNGDIRLLQAD